MLNKKIGIYVSAVIATAVMIVGSNQLKAALEGWEHAPDISSMNPSASYTYTASGNQNLGQYDRNGDGVIDLIITDRNGDGRADYWATDRNFDGHFNDYQYDRNFDGRIDQWEYDLDLDGVSDKIYVDADGDGKAELYAILNPINKTYTWYGNMMAKTAEASNATALQNLNTYNSSNIKNTYKGGKATDSF
jgi:hypothetical protein